MSALTAGAAFGAAELTEYRTGVNPYSAAVFDPFTASVFGMSMPGVKHRNGLQSGGAVGYRTLFTGVGKEAGLMQQASIGNMALQVARGAGHGLAQIPGVMSNPQMKGAAELLQQSHKIGLGGMVNSVSVGDAAKEAGVVDSGMVKSALRDGGNLSPTKSGNSIDHLAERVSGYNQGGSIRSHRAESMGSSLRKIMRSKGNRIGRAIAGMGAGKDVALSQTFKRVGGRLAPVLDDVAKGSYTAVAGSAGMMAGKLIKGAGYLQAASIGLDVAAYAAGEAYSSMVKVGREMDRRFDPNAMGRGYYSQAASTERRRAVTALNSAKLNPRTQLHGNEAYYHHR